MTEKEVVKKLRESIIFETAWLYRTMPESQEINDKMLEVVKVIWNRAFQRAGFVSDFHDLLITEEQILEAVEFWNSRKLSVIAVDTGESDNEPDDQSSS